MPGESWSEKLLSGVPYTDTLCLVFYTHLWLDLIASFLFFREHMDLLAGWIHHICYILIVSHSLYHHWTYGLALVFIEEIPTFVLALGSVSPRRFRSESVFGYTFLVFRVVCHAVLTVLLCVKIKDHYFIKSITLLAMGLHAHWFMGWVNRQKRLQRFKRYASSRIASGLLLPPSSSLEAMGQTKGHAHPSPDRLEMVGSQLPSPGDEETAPLSPHRQSSLTRETAGGINAGEDNLRGIVRQFTLTEGITNHELFSAHSLNGHIDAGDEGPEEVLQELGSTEKLEGTAKFAE
ncbi:putative transmembrane protein [Gregarina niphandrodes]|uniref:Transmembrane protein n=1 Tax=Gregarina niphandrodes TaxID=110365 RepID=A0A023B4U5_GRENI|nr:putative transmembrane protein [Gregarina niphandrodes]EZG57650.1 putative transmembrane protein [Gregarina niphandrodes]|eukprot:XP_011131042.1 putative transmembrane protein [Gregarina niphandrodes]